MFLHLVTHIFKIIVWLKSCTEHINKANGTHVRETLGDYYMLFYYLSDCWLAECASGRSCDRSSRHRFSWFRSDLKQKRWFQVPSCYCMVLMQPSRFNLIKVTPLIWKPSKSFSFKIIISPYINQKNQMCSVSQAHTYSLQP